MTPWHAIRDLTRREFAYAVAIGVMMGLLSGAGAALWQRNRVWWSSLLHVLFPTIAQAVFLLVCLTIASSFGLQGWRRIAAYVSAGIVAVAAAMAVYWYGVGPMMSLFGNDQGPPGGGMPVLVMLWINTPATMLAGILVAIAYMHFRDGQERVATLRQVQLDQAKLARDTYESRLRMVQARVEPQLLFETLRHVQALYATNTSTAERLLDDLILFLRRALPAIDAPTSSVAAEVALARAWLSIVEARRRGALHSTVRVNAGADRLRMPPMVLLPLVQRGAGTDSTIQTHVDIAIAGVGDRLQIVVAAFPGNSNFADTEAVEADLASLYGPTASVRVHELEHCLRLVLDLPAEAGAISAATG